MSVSIIVHRIDDEDLARWRLFQARYDALMEAKGVSLDVDLGACAAMIEEYYEVAAEILDKYEVYGEEAIECKISAYTGAIYIGREE